MIELYETEIGFFCDEHTYKIETNVVFTKEFLKEHINNLPIRGYDKQMLLNDMITTNPYGGATHTPIADVIREFIGDYLESYDLESIHIDNKDLKYIFRDIAQKRKCIRVSFLVSTKHFRYLALKYPEFHQQLRSTQ